MQKIFNFLGFLFAAVLFIGMMDKMGIKINANHQESSMAMLPDFSNDDPASDESVIRISPDEEETARMEREYVGSRATSKKVGNKAGSSKEQQIQGFIDRFSATAVDQALGKGIPAGISLAVGISKLQSGEHINSWAAFMEKIIQPLLQSKEDAENSKMRNYFKYSANSERWADGLAVSGAFSASALKKTMDHYELNRYDEEVRDRMSGEYRDPETEKKATYVADEVQAKRKSSSKQTSENKKRNSEDDIEAWKDFYNESVGHEVAKEVARKKIKSGQYMTDEDMQQLIDETNQETDQVLQNKTGFLGRKINANHPEAAQKLDISDPKNAQAREELYQSKLKEKRKNK
ncbi:MAG TPA: hypothetical protein PKA00_07875 [Saprospiraceae bacterium]|nr:hypothetical protein [Saprospiraceae bacterium]HMQ82810.1 hypothetical protein [Saprospiraceae bacterium]